MDHLRGLTDQSLVDAVISGRHAMYEILVLRHQEKVFNVLFRFLGQRESSEDVCQESFLTAYQKLDTFRGQCAFSTWVCQIALNKARDLLRRHKGVETLHEDISELADGLADADAVGPEGQLEKGQVNRRIQRVLSRLPAHYREVLVLKHVEEHSNEEIAQMLGESVGNVKVRTFRARQMFKEFFAQA